MLSAIGVASGFKFMSEVRAHLERTLCAPLLMGSGGTLLECSIRILPAQAQGLALARTKKLPLGSLLSKFTKLHRSHFVFFEFALLLVLCCRCFLPMLARLPACARSLIASVPPVQAAAVRQNGARAQQIWGQKVGGHHGHFFGARENDGARAPAHGRVARGRRGEGPGQDGARR